MEYVKRPKEQPEEITREIRETVSRIIADVERGGTDAVRRYSEQFDGWSPPSFRVDRAAIGRAYDEMEEQVAESGRFLIDLERYF